MKKMANNIYATRRELTASFKKHYYAYKHINSSEGVAQPFIYPGRLLLFYAIECGLKSLILKRESRNTTDDLFEITRLKEKLKGAKGHDIEEMLKFLKAGPFSLPELFFKGRSSAVPFKYNQVWRYGIQDSDNAPIQAELEQEMIRIADWIEGEI